MKITIDSERAKVVFDRALYALAAKKFPFEETQYPGEEDTLPKSLITGGKIHGIVLFNSCLYMRAGIKSDEAFSRFSHFYDIHPEYFNVDFFDVDENVGELRLRDSLRENSLGYNSAFVAKAWIHNLRKIRLHWRNDPANLFCGINSYEDAYERMIYTSSYHQKRRIEDPFGFMGFKEKISSLFMYFMMLNGLVEEFIFPPPIDVQLLRIMLSNRILVLYDKTGLITEGAIEYDKLTPHGRKVTYEYCLMENVNPLRLSEALWWLGRTACTRNPGNRSKQIGGRNGRQTQFLQEKVIWNKGQVQSYKWACRRCPIKETCELNVPGKTSSTRGTMELWGVRKRIPQKSLF